MGGRAREGGVEGCWQWGGSGLGVGVGWVAVGPCTSMGVGEALLVRRGRLLMEGQVPRWAVGCGSIGGGGARGDCVVMWWLGQGWVFDRRTGADCCVMAAWGGGCVPVLFLGVAGGGPTVLFVGLEWVGGGVIDGGLWSGCLLGG
jgi:hypothetical protein